MAPPTSPPRPEFDANRFQVKTAPPGFFEFARTAKSPALKLLEEPLKVENPVSGVPVYAAPMAPPLPNVAAIEASPVQLAPDVEAEADPRRADTLPKARFAKPWPPPETGVNPPVPVKGAAARRPIRNLLAWVLLLAFAVVALTIALSPSGLRSSAVPAGELATAARALPNTASAPLSTPSAPPEPPSSAMPHLVPPSAEPSLGKLPSHRIERAPALAPARPPLPRAVQSPAVEPKPARSAATALSPDDVPIFDRKPVETNAAPPSTN